MTDEADEKALLERSAAGDLTAFNPVVEKYRSRAYYYALSLMRNEQDALDLSQDAFAKAYRSLDKFDCSRPFLPWFLRMLRNLCFNALDKRKRQPALPGPQEGVLTLQLIPSSVPHPDAQMMRQEQADKVRAALLELSSEHREAIFLRHFEDMAYEQIATVLDVPVGTVMSRLFNGRRKLAQILKRDMAGE